MASCQVCLESFTKQLRKKVECPYCNYECCASCAQRYLSDSVDTAHCMQCKRAWTRGVLIKLFNKAYVSNVYRAARENSLFELEKAMFPDTMPHVEHAMLIIRNNHEIARLNQEMANSKGAALIFNNRASSEVMREQIPTMLENHRRWYEILVLEAEKEKPSNRTSNTPREFVKPCSRADCNGFLSTMWKCRVCSEYTCNACHEPKDADHICNPDTVKSVEQIKSDSKPCPKCVIPIFKIEGCDQMYCTSCHTAFSWRTGQIELGRIHNPHYYEYQRQNGHLNREIGDVQCGGMPMPWALPQLNPNLNAFHRAVLEFQQYQLPGYIQNDVNAFDLNLRTRVSFLCKTINEYVYKRELYRRDKEIAKKRELGMIATTFVQIVADLYTRLVSHRDSNLLETELRSAIEYSNGLFREISKIYDCVAPCIEYPRIEIKRY